MHKLAQKAVPAIEKMFNYLGSNTDAIIAVAIIASFKAVLRPTFTLADKHQPKERKQYAALRDFLTEAVAIPSYLVISNIGRKYLGENFAKPGNFKNAGRVGSFLGVCFAAGIAIPYLCNLALRPVMKLFKKYQDKKAGNISISAHKLDLYNLSPDVKPIKLTPANTPVIQDIPKDKSVWNYYNFNNPCMRVGN